MAPECAECLVEGFRNLPVDAAIERCGKAVDINPEYAGAYYCLAEKYFQKEQYRKAIGYYQKVRELHLGWSTSDNIIVSHFKLGEREKGLKLIDEERFDWWYYDWGSIKQLKIHHKVVLYKSVDEYDLALTECEKYIEEWPDNYIGYELKAGVLSSKKDFKNAIEQVNIALSKNPYCSSCFYSLGVYNKSLEKWDDAEKALGKAIELSHRNDSYWTELGSIYQEQGKNKKAKTQYQEALKINPRNKQAKEALEKLTNEK
ncbi:MAG: tetratricopeptide repeat protein, partial [bacterium]